VFYNRFNFELKFLICNPNTGEMYTVIVGPGTRRPIEVPRPGDYSFVVVGVNVPGVNVGVGVFNYRPGNCNMQCVPAYRDLKQFEFRFRVGVNWRSGPTYVYDCGCNDRVFYRDHYYDRVWVNGTREVLGTWQQPPNNQPKYFVPVYQRVSPVSTAYESYDCQCGVNPTANEASGADLPASNRVWYVVGGSLLIAAALGVWGVRKFA